MPEGFVPVEANGNPWMKPRKGGLWTAQWDEQYGGGWVQWCYGEDFDVPKDLSWEVTLLTPKPDARILVIDCLSDLKAAFERWPDPSPNSRFGKGYPAWHLIAKEFDAVHLTERGQWDTRLTMDVDLYGWDCESTLWLSWAFHEIQVLGRQEFEHKPWGDDE
jgi:hypothetical protein